MLRGLPPLWPARICVATTIALSSLLPMAITPTGDNRYLFPHVQIWFFLPLGLTLAELALRNKKIVFALNLVQLCAAPALWFAANFFAHFKGTASPGGHLAYLSTIALGVAALATLVTIFRASRSTRN